MRPLAIASCGVLILFALRPGLPLALAILCCSGVFDCFQVAASAAFVTRGAARPAVARPFGLAQAGMSLGQGTAMILAGAAAQHFAPAAVIAAAGALGAVTAVVIAVGGTSMAETGAARWSRARLTGQAGSLTDGSSHAGRSRASAAPQFVVIHAPSSHCRLRSSSIRLHRRAVAAGRAQPPQFVVFMSASLQVGPALHRRPAGAAGPLSRPSSWSSRPPPPGRSGIPLPAPPGPGRRLSPPQFGRLA